MKRYRTLFYASKWGDGHAIDNVIALATQAWFLFKRLWKRKLSWKQFWAVVKLGLSHEETWTPESGWDSYATIKPYGVIEYTGACYTSTMGQAGGKNRTGNGTCVRNADRVLKHPERWSYTEHEVSDDAYDFMIRYLDKQVAKNKGYGLGPDKNVCSELSHNANVTSGELAGPYRFISPLGDALLLVKSGKEIIPLKG